MLPHNSYAKPYVRQHTALYILKIGDMIGRDAEIRCFAVRKSMAEV